MEGSWRGSAARRVVAVSMVALALAAIGCGDDGSSRVEEGTVRTAAPERAFAPRLEVAREEPWRPMSARWFVERAILGVAGCEERRIAVGHTMPELQNEVIDWIFPAGLGAIGKASYYRGAYDERCELDFDRQMYAEQLTRPHDRGPRLDGVTPDQGFFMDLADDARGGPPLPERGRLTVPVYVERFDEGDSGVRLAYWTLYGRRGRLGGLPAREGDWRRVDVLLDASGDGYRPRAVQLFEARGERVEVPWNETARVGGSHPVFVVEPGTHRMRAAPSAESCSRCVEWRAWDVLADAREQPWYGFGGAWGEVGHDDATTGPLGPHGEWLSAEQKQRQLAERAGFD
jgi:hypothetical protein